MPTTTPLLPQGQRLVSLDSGLQDSILRLWFDLDVYYKGISITSTLFLRSYAGGVLSWLHPGGTAPGASALGNSGCELKNWPSIL
jgi:hypothetical protein